MATNNSEDRLRDLLKAKDFRTFLISLVISALGSVMTQFALSVSVLDLTHSPTKLTLVSAVGYLPFLFVGLPAGAIIDRFDRRKIMQICDLLRLLITALLGLCAWTHTLSFPIILIAALISGMFSVFHTVAESSLLPQLVPSHQLNRANGIMYAFVNSCWLIGPAIAGFVYNKDKAWVLFAFDAVSFLISYAVLSQLRTRFGVSRPVANFKIPIKSDIKNGLLEIWKRPFIFHSLIVVTLINIFGQNLSNYVFAYNKEVLGINTDTLGIALGIIAAGGIAGSYFSAEIAKWLSFPRLLFCLVLLDSMARVFIPYSNHLIGVVALAAIVSFMQSVLNVVVISYRQSSVPNEMQGVVNSAFKSVVFLSRPISQLMAGTMMSMMGLTKAFQFNGWLFFLPLAYAAYYFLRGGLKPASEAGALNAKL